MKYPAAIISIILISISIATAPAFAQNQNISKGFVFDGEPYLAVNPANNRHMAVAWMGFVPANYIAIKTKATFDAGKTWSETKFIPHQSPSFGSADPSIAFNNAGDLFLAYIDFNASKDSGAVYIRKSNDGGLSWESPVEVINVHSDADKKPVDRPWINIDRTGGPYDGNIYITTMPPTVFGTVPPPYHPYLTRSADGGASFDQWKYIDNAGWLAGNLIPQPTPFATIANDGVFYCVYPSWVFAQNANPQFIFAASADAGNNFTYSSIILPFKIAFRDTLSKRGYLLLADPSDENHLVFINLIIPHGDADVYLWESFDKALNWTEPVRINDDPIANNRMQDLIWADFNSEGDLAIAWRDRRNADDSNYAAASEIWGAVRRKDSSGFAPNFKISDALAAYDTVLSFSGNDFMSMEFIGDTLNAVWGDVRNGKLNIWFQRMSADGIISSVRQISSESLPDVRVYPNPFASEVTIEGNNITKIAIYNQNGNIESIYEDIKETGSIIIDLSALPKGAYLVKTTTDEGIITNKIVKYE